jgi:threonine/homoserine/homoserine lactone efflux protein
MNFLFLGLFLGLSTSMPIGPVNLEIARRTLSYGFRFGFVTGLGAVTADLVFLCLLSLGILHFVSNPHFLYLINIFGSLLIMYFGLKACFSKIIVLKSTIAPQSNLLSFYVGGLGMTLLNPLSILFWFSVSAQLIGLPKTHSYALELAGIGVLLGTTTWMTIYNSLIHVMKTKLNPKYLSILNKLSGVLLIAFAVRNLFHL